MTVPTRLEIKLFRAQLTFMNFFWQVFFASNFKTFALIEPFGPLKQ
jgi:hypothetical protein